MASSSPTSAEARTLEGILVEPVIEFDPRQLDLLLGIFVAAFVGVPIALTVGTGLIASGILVSLGAFNVYLGQGLLAPPTRLRVAGLACVVDAIAVGLGTLVAASGSGELPLIALCIGGLQLALFLPHSRSVALSSAGVFAIAIGLPAGTPLDAAARVALVAAGGGWGLLGSFLESRVRRRWSARTKRSLHTEWVRGPVPPTSLPPIATRRIVALALTLGVTSASAYAVAAAIGLPRDYWSILAVVVVLQSGLLATLSMAVVRVGGTSVGALIGGYLSIAVTESWAVCALVAGFAGAALAVRNANRVFYVVFLTPFVLLLLGVAYPAGWAVAIGRVLDTVVGGAVALCAGVVMWAALRATDPSR